MNYKIIDENGLEVLVDKNAWVNYLKQFSKQDIVYVSKQELLAEFIDTYSDNIDDIDWDYSSEEFLVLLNEPIEETIAMKNQWRDYREDDSDVEVEEEDF